MKRKKADTRDRIAIADALGDGDGWYVWVSPRLQFYGGTKRPSWWFQFWQWAFLGWYWTKNGEPHPRLK